MKTLVVCSGGLDSITLAHRVKADHELVGLISFDYGQRHVKELAFAAQCSQSLGVPHHIVDISHVGQLLSGSALTDADNIHVPDGHYREDTMKATIVPNRNAIMMTIAYGAAISMGAEAVAAAVHAGDHFIYPDCRPEFIQAFDAMQKTALEGVADIQLFTPYVNLTKADIAKDSKRYNVPVVKTWSCYKGLETHCGRCGTCVERREAFHEAGIEDTTSYADPDFWQKAVSDYQKEHASQVG